MRKIFTFLCAALMSVGMWATTVTWDSNTLSSIYIYDGQSFTQDGVTVTSLIGMIYGETGQWMGNSNDASFKFSTSLGNFTKIEITATIHSFGGSGWTQTSPGAVWTGEANETTFGGYFEAVSQIVFTIAESEPEPAGEVTVVFAANDKTVERTVTLPHTFKCDWYYGIESQKELDIIIHELYSDYEYCNNNIQASGSDQVEVGTESNSDDYITIKGVFEGTATVTGSYWDVNYGVHNYSLTISIKGGEPEPQPAATDTITWDNDFCMDVEAYYDGDDERVIEDNNTKDGITVTFVGNEIDDGLTGDVIELFDESSILTFTSTVGNIHKIEIYYTENTFSTPNGWTLDATNKKFVWEGTPAAAVKMQKGTGNVDFEVDHIVFIVESQGIPTAVENVHTNQVQAIKFFRDGMLLIERDGKIYNITGTPVR